MKPTANEQILLTALLDAAQTIQSWHGITCGSQERPKLWEIYCRASPEMKRIKAALDLFTEKPSKGDPKLF